jgi:nicotine blue oxidoreductase
VVASLKVDGLVLAAGQGRRFGGPKAVARVGGERLVDRAVRALRVGGVDSVYVVQGAVDLDVPDARVLDNPDWASGLGSSLRCGLDAVAGDAVLVMLVDTPGVGGEVVRRMVDAFRAGARAAVATYGGAPGNPALIAREHWADVAGLAVGDVGARAFIALHPELVHQVECGDVGSPDDLDTPEDLARLTS